MALAHGGWGCCDTCAFRETDNCDECEDAGFYEPDLDVIEEEAD